jgi:hypothetical protein
MFSKPKLVPKLTEAEPVLPAWLTTRLLAGFGVIVKITFWIDQLSAIEFSVPAVPLLTVPANSKIGLFTTADEIITGVPVLVVVPEAFVIWNVVVVDAVIVNVPLLPVAPPVYPVIEMDAPTQALEPEPVSVAAYVYCQMLPEILVGAVEVLKANVVEEPVTVGVVFAHVQLTALVWLNVVENPAFDSKRFALAFANADQRVADVPQVIAVDPPPWDVRTVPAAPTVVGRLKLYVVKAPVFWITMVAPDDVLVANPRVPAVVPFTPRTGTAVYAGAPEDPVLFPNKVPPPALVREKVNAGVVVEVATDVVKSGERFPAENDVTVPVPAGMSAVTRARKVGVVAAPEVGPASTLFADCVFNVRVTAPVDALFEYSKLSPVREFTTEAHVMDVEPPAWEVNTCPAVPGPVGRLKL